MNMNIRPMTIQDYDEVFKMWNETAGMGMRSLDDSYEGIERFLLRNPETSFVALQDGQIIGVILCGQDGRRGYIYHTAVKQDFRKQGIGKALVDAALSALKKEQINKAALVVFDSNELGNHFWESIGFIKRNDLTYRNISINDQNI